MSRNRAAILFFVAVFLFGSPFVACAKLDMMSDASIIAFLSQSLGGDTALAVVAWEGMNATEKQKVREDAARLLKIAAEARKKYGNKQEVNYQIEWFKASLFAELYADDAAKTADLSEENLKKFYENNKDAYSTGARVRFRQIICASEGDAKRVYGMLQSPKSNFGTIAKDISIDLAGAMNGGETGWIPRDKLSADFAKKLFEVELNRVCLPVKLGDDWIVFEVLEREVGKIKSFEQVRDIVRYEILRGIPNDI